MPSSGVLIRSATEADVDLVLHMQQELEREGIGYGVVADTREHVSNMVGPYFVVADEPPALVGYAYGCVRTSDGLAVTPQGERYLEIEELYVAPERRRQGLGGQLLQTLIDRAADGGIMRIHVFSGTKDHDAILRFYRRYGFTPWGVQLFR